MLTKTEIKLLGYFYPLLFLIAYLQARALIPPYYYPTTGLISWPFRLFVLYVGIKCFLHNKQKNTKLQVFILVSLASFLLYLISDYPIALYVNAVAFYILPMFMAFVALNKSDTSILLESMFWSSMVLFIVGLYLFFFNPSWYISGISEHYNNAWYQDASSVRSDEWLKENTRLSSFMLSSYAVSYFSMYTLPYALYRYSISPERKTKRFYLICAIIIIITAMLCQQRAAIAMVILTLFSFIYLQNRQNLIKAVILLFLIGGVGYVISSIYSDNPIVALILERFDEMTFGKAMEGSRTDQVSNALSSIDNLLLGKGIGSGGGEARRYGFVGVTDSNYVKMFYEQGVIGIIIFAVLSLSTLFRGLKNIRYLFVETLSVFAILFSMIGADPLTYFFYILPFWYCVGKIWNKEYLFNLKQKDVHI